MAFLWHQWQILFIEPFTQYVFLKRALIGCWALCVGCGPIGSFMVLRRMSLVGDALSHGLLPGVAIAFLLSGFSVIGLSIGGLVAGLGVALAASWAENKTTLSRDSTFAAFFLISMAFGILVLAVFGNHLDLMHVLLGTVLSLSRESLIWISSVSSVSLVVLTLIYRPLVLRSFDPAFFRSLGGNPTRIDFIFLTLVTVNLVSAFQALGTLMALGLLILPAVTARLFARQIWTLAFFATFLGMCSSYGGLLIAYHLSCPAGPAIVLVGGIFYGLALGGQFFRPRRFLWALGGAFFFIVFLGGIFWFFPARPFDSEKPSVVVTFTVLEDFVQQLGGDKVTVISFVGPNGDVHTYEPTPRDIITLQKASLIVINGLGLEGQWMQQLLKDPALQERVVVASSGCVPRVLSMGSQKVTDPHAWQDVQNARFYLLNLYQALQKLLPSEDAFLKKRFFDYDDSLRKLDQWIHLQMQTLSPVQRKVLTTHDGFGYYGRSYGITFLSPWGLSTDVEPSPLQLRRLLKDIRTGGIRVLFLENMMNPRLMEEISRETGLLIGGTLFSDALSEKNGPAGTYLDMMRHNTQTLVDGMGVSSSASQKRMSFPEGSFQKGKSTSPF
jgi:ABC-type Zn uptake system ZnuABC Zn-binding protein ZnuA/ABC-type Mn2+/Zn2+ transport system permease subunit